MVGVGSLISLKLTTHQIWYIDPTGRNGTGNATILFCFNLFVLHYSINFENEKKIIRIVDFFIYIVLVKGFYTRIAVSIYGKGL